MKHEFLPSEFESLKIEKPYWKMSQMKEGENRFRIVMRPIAGWMDWKDNKPMRFRPSNKPSAPVDASKPIKPFWALHVWDYAREALFILEITQNSIIKTLTALGHDEDWGDFLKYDLKVKKEGAGKDTRYTITPLPHKPLSERVLKAIAACPVRLEALYEGGDPWTDLTAFNEETGEVLDPGILTEAQCDELDAITLKDAALEKKICENLKIDNIYRTPAKDFDRVRDYAEKYRDNLEKKRNIA
jgi:hypothetical protein